MLSSKPLLRSQFAGGASFPTSPSSRFTFTLPAIKSLYEVQGSPLPCLGAGCDTASGVCGQGQLPWLDFSSVNLPVKRAGFGQPLVRALLWMMGRKVHLVLLKWQ